MEGCPYEPSRGERAAKLVEEVIAGGGGGVLAFLDSKSIAQVSFTSRKMHAAVLVGTRAEKDGGTAFWLDKLKCEFMVSEADFFHGGCFTLDINKEYVSEKDACRSDKVRVDSGCFQLPLKALQMQLVTGSTAVNTIASPNVVEWFDQVVCSAKEACFKLHTSIEALGLDELAHQVGTRRVYGEGIMRIGRAAIRMYRAMHCTPNVFNAPFRSMFTKLYPSFPHFVCHQKEKHFSKLEKELEIENELVWLSLYAVGLFFCGPLCTGHDSGSCTCPGMLGSVGAYSWTRNVNFVGSSFDFDFHGFDSTSIGFTEDGPCSPTQADLQRTSLKLSSWECAKIAGSSIRSGHRIDMRTGQMWVDIPGAPFTYMPFSIRDDVADHSNDLVLWIDHLSERIAASVYVYELIPRNLKRLSLFPQNSLLGANSAVTERHGIRVSASAAQIFRFDCPKWCYELHIQIIPKGDPGHVLEAERGFARCQLLSRKWHIQMEGDAFYSIEGAGVVGLFPELSLSGDGRESRYRTNFEPGQREGVRDHPEAGPFSYSSMVGEKRHVRGTICGSLTFQSIGANTLPTFEVPVGLFKLEAVEDQPFIF